MTSSPIQQTALYLYDLGFNIFPQPRTGRQIDWSPIRYTRVARSQIQTLFDGTYDIGILTGLASGNGLAILSFTDDATLDRYLDTASDKKIPVWGIKDPAGGGHIWLRTRDPLMAHRDREEKLLTLLYQHPITEVPHTTRIPLSTAGTLIWYRSTWATDQALPQLYRWQIQNLDVHEQLSRFEHQRDPPQYLIELDQALDAGDITLDAYQTQRREAKRVHAERYYNRVLAWEKALTAVIHQRQWTGREGFTELAVICALTRHLNRIENVTLRFRATVREIALLAYLDKNTVSRALHRLQALDPPIIEHVSTHASTEAYMYTFSNALVAEGARLRDTSDPVQQVRQAVWDAVLIDSYLYDELMRYYPDILSRKALGYPGLLVHALLTTHPHLQKRKIATYLNFSLTSTKTLCRHLRDQGIIIQDDRYRYQACSLDDIDWYGWLTQLGVRGKWSAQFDQFTYERQTRAGEKLLRNRKRNEQHG